MDLSRNSVEDLWLFAVDAQGDRRLKRFWLRITDEINVGVRGAAVDIVQRRSLICGYLEIRRQVVRLQRVSRGISTEKLTLTDSDVMICAFLTRGPQSVDDLRELARF